MLTFSGIKTFLSVPVYLNKNAQFLYIVNIKLSSQIRSSLDSIQNNKQSAPTILPISIPAADVKFLKLDSLPEYKLHWVHIW